MDIRNYVMFTVANLLSDFNPNVTAYRFGIFGAYVIGEM